MLDLLNDLFEILFCVFMMGGMQFYSVVVICDVEKKEIFFLVYFNQLMVKEVLVVLIFCVDFCCFCKYCQERNVVLGYGNLMFFLNVVMDILLVVQIFCMFVEEVGLGICYLGIIIYNF